MDLDLNVDNNEESNDEILAEWIEQTREITVEQDVKIK